MYPSKATIKIDDNKNLLMLRKDKFSARQIKALFNLSTLNV